MLLIQLLLLGSLIAASLPCCVGGGIKDLATIQGLLAHGADKISLNSAAVEDPALVEAASPQARIGQSVCVSIDVKGDTVHIHGGKTDTGLCPVMHAKAMQALGAGEILLNRVERDGTMEGYDLDLLIAMPWSRPPSTSPSSPAGAALGTDADLLACADRLGAHAVAAGALWSFH
jgi:cyclase